MDKISKFLLKLTKKERGILFKIMEDVRILNLKHYDIKPLKGCHGFFRLRKGDIRVVFSKQNGGGMIFDVNYRKDIY